jgi:hypothetical protein
MEAARKFIQAVRLVMVAALVMYVYVVLTIPSKAAPNPIILRAFTAVSIAIVILIFVMRRVKTLPSEAMLAREPQDSKALSSLRQGYLITYTLSFSIALYGVVLHFFGFPLSQISPFFIAAFALILYFGPKVVVNPSGITQSGPIMPR